MKRNNIGYPAWKSSIPQTPTDKEVESACKRLFNKTPSEVNVNEIDMTEYTDDPTVNDGDPIYYTSGDDIATDANGAKFYLLDMKQAMPNEWKSVHAAHVIKNHINSKGLKEGDSLA